MLRREFLLGVAGSALCSASGPDFKLIAHRGGVVGPDRPENSAAALAAAIEHGYWMAEVDVRRTKDGEPILHHDGTLAKIYGDPRRPEDMTWAELKTLKAKANGAHPVHFEEACALCSGKMRFMLDLKTREWPTEFYQRLVKYMEAAKIPAPTYSLAGPDVLPFFEGQVIVSVSRKELKARADRGEPVAKQFMLFELASEADAAGLALCNELKVVYIAAINTFRYTMAKRDEETGPAEDARRLRALGIQYYQIDSRYEGLFKA